MREKKRKEKNVLFLFVFSKMEGKEIKGKEMKLNIYLCSQKGGKGKEKGGKKINYVFSKRRERKENKCTLINQMVLQIIHIWNRFTIIFLLL